MTARAGHSAGILLYRRGVAAIEVFLVHPGGPFFAKKDLGAWSIPKGEIEQGEEAFDVAVREFEEETGQSLASCASGTTAVALGTVQQRGGKIVSAWAIEGDWPAGAVLVSNVFELEWPPRSGKRRRFPEADDGRFFPLAEARGRINPAQAAFVDRLVDHLEANDDGSTR